jgi:nitroreductase
VGKEIIDELLSLAQMAPSAGNLQSRDFIVVKDKTTKTCPSCQDGIGEYYPQGNLVIKVLPGLSS